MSWLFPSAKEKSRYASHWAIMLMVLAFVVSVMVTVGAIYRSVFSVALYTGLLSVTWLALLVISPQRPRLAFVAGAGAFVTIWPASIYLDPDGFANFAIFTAIFSVVLLKAALFYRSDAEPETIP